jgi:hypothetical protein
MKLASDMSIALFARGLNSLQKLTLDRRRVDISELSRIKTLSTLIIEDSSQISCDQPLAIENIFLIGRRVSDSGLVIHGKRHVNIHYGDMEILSDSIILRNSIQSVAFKTSQ